METLAKRLSDAMKAAGLNQPGAVARACASKPTRPCRSRWCITCFRPATHRASTCPPSPKPWACRSTGWRAAASRPPPCAAPPPRAPARTAPGPTGCRCWAWPNAAPMAGRCGTATSSTPSRARPICLARRKPMPSISWATPMEPRYYAGELAHIHPGKPITIGAFVLVQIRPNSTASCAQSGAETPGQTVDHARSCWSSSTRQRNSRSKPTTSSPSTAWWGAGRADGLEDACSDRSASEFQGLLLLERPEHCWVHPLAIADMRTMASRGFSQGSRHSSACAYGLGKTARNDTGTYASAGRATCDRDKMLAINSTNSSPFDKLRVRMGGWRLASNTLMARAQPNLILITEP